MSSRVTKSEVKCLDFFFVDAWMHGCNALKRKRIVMQSDSIRWHMNADNRKRTFYEGCILAAEFILQLTA